MYRLVKLLSELTLLPSRIMTLILSQSLLPLSCVPLSCQSYADIQPTAAPYFASYLLLQVAIQPFFEIFRFGVCQLS